MPLYDMKCPKCGYTWEALVVKSTDGDKYICEKCTTPGKQQVSKGVDWKIWGYAARNSYGIKKFDDGRD